MQADIDKLHELTKATSVTNGTSLITLYLPAGMNLWLAREHIISESKLTSNIKSKQVGSAVTSALKSVSYQLKLLEEIPSNGMVIVAGEQCL